MVSSRNDGSVGDEATVKLRHVSAPSIAARTWRNVPGCAWGMRPFRLSRRKVRTSDTSSRIPATVSDAVAGRGGRAPGRATAAGTLPEDDPAGAGTLPPDDGCVTDAAVFGFR